MIVAIVAGVGGFWLLLTALVRRDKGWVGISDLRRIHLRLLGGFALMRIALGEALRPAVQKALRSMNALAAVMDTMGDDDVE